MEFELIESGLLIFLCLFVCLFICFFCSVHVDGLGEGCSRIIVHFLLRSAALPQTGNATDKETGTHGPTGGCGQRQTSGEIKRIIVNFLLRQCQVDGHGAARVVVFCLIFCAHLITDLRQGAVGMMDGCWVLMGGLLEPLTS